MTSAAALPQADKADELALYVLLDPSPQPARTLQLTRRLDGNLRRLTQILVAMRFLQDHYELGFSDMQGSGVSNIRLHPLDQAENLQFSMSGLFQEKPLVDTLVRVLNLAGLTDVSACSDDFTGEWFVSAQSTLPASAKLGGY